MAYIDNGKRVQSSTMSFHKNYLNNSAISLDVTEIIKIVLTMVVVFFYVRPLTKISAELVSYELAFLLCFGITGAFMARHKRNMLNGFLLGVLMCPLGLILAAYLNDRTRTSCRHCAEKIKITAKVCPFCKTDLTIKTADVHPNQEVSED